MSRDSFRKGADDAQHSGKPNTGPYLMDSSYAEGFDSYMKAHPWCSKCGGGEAMPGTNPLLCEECFAKRENATWGGMDDPETKKEEER